ncbi:hypothetical protein E2562_004269 [Oryza meyeriana var. granulata]|uniref:Uncharacterized protein n=1 Tax=Oryza meyeriana var. granulata TaxID=110450 RepID=A0A6G1BTP3_9ORYZ|nr:hypothetical protein E2562_004269 [Oryza meyeriana var. granulata]
MGCSPEGKRGRKGGPAAATLSRGRRQGGLAHGGGRDTGTGEGLGKEVAGSDLEKGGATVAGCEVPRGGGYGA